ncbi:MAG: type II toxin-antitoxin system Phd/YefM family antitoxin [bacterium]
MSLKDSIKPISYLKANAAKVIKDVSENGKILYITQNGEAKVVVQNITDYEKTQDTLAMLKILALGEEDIKKGNYRPAKEVFADLKKKIQKLKNEV